MARLARAVVLIGLVARTGHGDELSWLPGNSREISRTTSASLDAPVTGVVFAPRVEMRAAGDLAFMRIPFEGVALRPGFAGFCDVQYSEPGGFWPAGGKGPILFRGNFGFSLALSAERLARSWFGKRGAIEVAVVLGHESDHVLGSGPPDSGFVNAPLPGDIINGGGGNFLVYDLAVRVPMGAHFDVWSRLVDRAFLPGFPIQNAPGLEAGVRWHLWHYFEPLVSVFGEGLLVDHDQNEAKDGGDAELLAGIAVPGTFGELVPYTSLDIGNQKGLLINHREIDLIIGVRYAPF
jgi:hypothetical protein